MGDYKQLKVWRAAHAMVKDVYQVSVSFPFAERWRLTNQVCRAAASVPANIAEGAGRNTDGEFARFLGIALGSANETEYHLLLAKDLDYLAPSAAAPLEGQWSDIKRMLAGLISTVTTKGRRRSSIAPTRGARTFRADS